MEMQFGSVLRRMRRLADFSQEELAEKLHISRSNISKLESDKMQLRAADMINWCKVTKHPDVLMAFIYGTDVMTALASTAQFIGTIFLGGI